MNDITHAGHYCAVVKYPLGASFAERRKLLVEGLQTVAMELIDLGCDLAEVEDYLDGALRAAEWEAENVG